MNGLPVIFLAFASERSGYLTHTTEESSERRRITTHLAAAEVMGHCKLVVVQDAALSELARVFRQYHNRIAIFHFVGDVGTLRQLMAELAAQECLQLVFLSGCGRTPLAEELAKDATFAVVLMAESIDDRIATEFAGQFYWYLAEGESIGSAFDKSKTGVATIAGREARNLYREPDEALGEWPWSLHVDDAASDVISWGLAKDTTVRGAQHEEAHAYTVWFGTNRAMLDASDPSLGFANERDADGTIHFGTCDVKIPRTHVFGSIGTSFWKRWWRLWTFVADDRVKLRATRTFNSEDAFLRSVQKELTERFDDERTVVVYIHGYNTSFEDAAVRAAQIGFDLKVPGVTAFYSWPSKSDVKAYPADIARVEASEVQIAEFLMSIANRSDAKQVHVIAHSMGNRGFARAISRITSHAATTGGVKFGQIILAAPDIDVDLFKQLAVAYPMISDRTTMYVSAKDKPLAMSSWLQDSDRAGFTPPVTVVDGIDTVEVTHIDVTLLGHGYWAQAAPVLYDIKELIDWSTPPEKRIRIASTAETDARYWTIRP